MFAFADGSKTSGELVPGMGDGMTVTGTPYDDYYLYGSPGYDSIYGLEGSDSLYGMGANDLLEGGAGYDNLNGGGRDDTLEGGADGDWASYSGTFADYSITYNASTRQYTLVDQVAGRDGTDVVRDVEMFAFADGPKTSGELVPGM